MAEPPVQKKVPRRVEKSATAFRTISEVATELDLPQHVLRFWESKFLQVRPMKRGGGRRYYRPEDIVLLRRIRFLLHEDGYTIRGVQKLLHQNGSQGDDGAGTNSGSDAPAKPRLDSNQRAELEAVLGELEALRGLLAKAGQ
jgi:DNA-binding transcriptional MerR regulator